MNEQRKPIVKNMEDNNLQLRVKWGNHQEALISTFANLLENETLVDCTLRAEGKSIKVHKIVLAACSPYFATLLNTHKSVLHPVFSFKHIKFQELRSIIDYMYRGELNTSQNQLTSLLKAAQFLDIKSLFDNWCSVSTVSPKQSHSVTSSTTVLAPEIIKTEPNSPYPRRKANLHLKQPVHHMVKKEPKDTNQEELDETRSENTDELPQAKRRCSQRTESIDKSELIVKPTTGYDSSEDYNELDTSFELEDFPSDLSQEDSNCDGSNKNEVKSTVTKGNCDIQEPSNAYVAAHQPKLMHQYRMTMADGVVRYVCPQCGVKYTRPTALVNHLKECGKGAQCPLCPEVLTQRRNLPRHIARHHRNRLGLLGQMVAYWSPAGGRGISTT